MAISIRLSLVAAATLTTVVGAQLSGPPTIIKGTAPGGDVRSMSNNQNSLASLADGSLAAVIYKQSTATTGGHLALGISTDFMKWTFYPLPHNTGHRVHEWESGVLCAGHKCDVLHVGWSDRSVGGVYHSAWYQTFSTSTRKWVGAPVRIAAANASLKQSVQVRDITVTPLDTVAIAYGVGATGGLGMGADECAIRIRKKGQSSFSAQYAMRYRQGDDPSGDERITRVTGKHAVAIHVDRGTGALRFMRDTVDELYELEDGGSLGFKGFILTWFDGVSRMDRAVVEDTVARVLREAVSQPDSSEAGTSLSDISIESREEGVVLSINRIHFVADQAVILPEERPRLQAVAEALKRIEGRTFLVVGHTARIGSDESQYALSVERAKTIVDHLVSQGMEAGRFIYEGRGGTQPVAPNDVEENMAKNRRVEIVILED